MDVLTACVVGVLAGAHTATWGMYKDAAHEGFELRKYFRSIVLSGTIAPGLVLAGFDIAGIGSLLVLFGVTYVLERAINEFYKTFLRDEDQSKYFIPMQFTVRGRPVSRRARLQVGAAYVLVAAVLLVVVLWLQQWIGPDPGAATVLAVGSIGGWCSAFGGAWKDAPIEGFEWRKFFRSPVLAALYALALSAFTDSLVLAGLGGLGFTVATLETYKTFFFPSKPRGKFAGKPVAFPAMLQRRYWFVPLYAGIWVLLLAGFAAGSMGERPDAAGTAGRAAPPSGLDEQLEVHRGTPGGAQ
ncbi:MAG TPA: hypothetical protein VK939_00520 [Longimicrobiales bacterium]|nr:hypothetical protein [Longimicrobiales bacterium]